MTNDELTEALASLDMETWLDRESITYRHTRGSRGPQLNVRECPCCGNTNWKVFLNAENGLGNCFSGDCEEKFNKWKFIKSSLGSLTNKQVIDNIKQSASEQGWMPPRTKSVAVNLNTKLKLPNSIELPYRGRNLRYLTNRDIDNVITEYFGLRFSEKGVFKYLGEDGKIMIQNYANRIIIPIFNQQGDLVSFQGRDITGTAEKKYLFPPGFSATGSYLYNDMNAVGAKKVVLGEGVFDVMAIKIALDGQSELRDVVPIGTFGKHLSDGNDDSQVGKLMKLKEAGLEEVTVMWDGEDVAINDAVDAGLLMRSYGLKVRIAILPDGKDPNEVAPSVVREAFWKATVLDSATATKIKMSRRIK